MCSAAASQAFLETLDAAFRLRDEGSWAHKVGDVDGERFVMVMAVGPAADRLLAVIAANSIPDPRSTAAPDGEAPQGHTSRDEEDD